MLHLYLLVARLRALDRPIQRRIQKQLLDGFFWDAEERIKRTHNITKTMTRQAYLQDLYEQWRGLLFSYDQGVIDGDAALAAAIWRNVFRGDPDVDARQLAAIVCWMRRCLYILERLPDPMILDHADTVLLGVPLSSDLGRLGVINPELVEKIEHQEKLGKQKAAMEELAKIQAFMPASKIEAAATAGDAPVAVPSALRQARPASRLVLTGQQT